MRSFVNTEFKATSRPVARKRCRTRGGHSSSNRIKINLPLQPKQLLPQPQLQPCSSYSNKRPLCTPSKQPHPSSDIDFTPDSINNSILLQDIVDTDPSTIPPFPMTPSKNSHPLSTNKYKTKDVKFNNLNSENNNENNNENSSSDIPSTPQPYIPHIPLSDDIDDFTWSEDSRGFREFLFAGSSGVKINVADPTCPLSIIKTFLTDELLSNIVLFTNTYAELCKMHPSFIEKVGGCNRTLLNLWKEVTKDDMGLYMSNYFDGYHK